MRFIKGRQFEKQYKKLPIKTQRQFIDKIKIYEIDQNHPLLSVHSLKGKYKGLLSFNVSGDIRVIFDRSYKSVVILIAIGSHSELYS